MALKWGNKFAVSFGLGLSSDNEVSYFSGPSWRLGTNGYVTFGVNWREVSRLPNGQALNAPSTREDTLSNNTAKKRTLAYSCPGHTRFLAREEKH